MALQDQYPTLVDPQYQEFADRAHQAILEDRLRRTPKLMPLIQPPQENSLLTDIGHGLAKGVMVQAPELFGQTLQAFGADETGKQIEQAAQERGKDELYRTTGLAGNVASMLPSVLGISSLALIPGVGEITTPVIGGSLLSELAGAGLFGGSTYTQTREKGGSTAQGLAAGAIQAASGGVSGAIGGKLVSGAANAVQGRALARGFEAYTNPSTIGPVVRGLAHAEAVQLPVQAAAAAGVAAAQSGLPDTPTPWQAAKDSFAPTALLTAALSPFGLPGIMKTNTSRAQIAATIQNPNASMFERGVAVQAMARELRQTDIEGATRWQLNALEAINAGVTPELRPDYVYEPEKQPPPPPNRFAPAGLPLPAPGELAPPDVAAMGGSDGAQTPFDLSRQHAAQSAADRNAEMWAARDAEDARMAPYRTERPATTGMEVRDLGPLEHVDVRDVPEQIDIKAPHEVPTYDVKEVPTESIDLKVPEDYNTINQQKRAEWLKGILGGRAPVGKLSAFHSDELAREVQKLWHERGGDNGPNYAPKLEELYRRLTGRDIRDATLTPEETNAPQATAEDSQGTKPQSAADEAGAKAAADAEQNAGAAGNAEPGVRAGQAAPEGEVGRSVGYGEFSRRAPTKEELDAALEGKAPLPAETIPQGATAEQATRAYQVARARMELQRENQGEHGAPRSPEELATHDASIAAASQAEEAARAKYAGVTPELQEARQRLAHLDAQDNQLGQLREVYNELVRSKKPVSPELRAKVKEEIRVREAAQREVVKSGEREQLEQRVRELADVATLTPEHSELSRAVGRTESALQRGAKEPATDASYYSFTKGLEPNTPVARGANLARTFSYLEATKYVGKWRDLVSQIPDHPDPKTPGTLRRIVGEMGDFEGRLGSQQPNVKRAAEKALASMSPAEHAQFVKYVTHIASSIDTAARLNEPGKSAEKKYAKAMREHFKIQAEFDYLNDKVLQSAKDGNITEAEARSLQFSIEEERDLALRVLNKNERYDELTTRLFTHIYGKYERDIARADAEGTGLSRINNEQLAAKVADSQHSADILSHLGRTHHNPLIRAVAKLLAAAKPTATIRVIENPDFNGGRYVPWNDMIEIGRGGMNTTTMLHEITHALAHAGITRALANIGRAGLSAREQKEVTAIQGIQSIMERFAKIADPGNPTHMYALKSEHEFLSEGLNNPDMQMLLGGRANLLTRLFDWVRDLVPAWSRAKSDFEQLMQAAPTLFGSPNRSLNLIFRNPLNYSVRDPFTASVNAFRQLSGFDFLNHKIDQGMISGVKEDIHARYLKSTSLNHQRQMLKQILDAAKQKFPAFKSTIDKFSRFQEDLRTHVADRASVIRYVETEGGDIAARLYKFRNEHRKLFDAMGFWGTESTRLRINAMAKSFTEARIRNPRLTPEEWNHPDAQKMREKRAEFEAISERMRRQYGKDTDTPISLYEKMVDFHDLQLTRKAAEDMALAIRTYGAHLVPEMQDVMKQLDFRTHIGDAVGAVPARDQQLAISRGMKQALRIVGEIQAREIAAGPKSKGAIDATSLKNVLSDAHTWHELLRTVPYMHIGRAGKHMLMFTVEGGEHEWNTISNILNPSLREGGLDRAMGPAHQDNRRIYMKFDNLVQYNEAVNRLLPYVNRGVLSGWANGPINEKLRSQDSATPGFIKAMRDRILNDEQLSETDKQHMVSQLYDTHLQQQPDNSPLKSSASRDGLNGYSTDYIRSFVDRTKMGAKSLAGMRSASRIGATMVELGGAMRELRDIPGMNDFKNDIGRYTEDFRGRVESMNTAVESPVIDQLRALPAFWRLAMQPAYWATIAYQPWQITMPMLGAKFGYVNTLDSMSSNFGRSIAVLNTLLRKNWLETAGESTFDRWASLSNLRLEFSKVMNKDGTPMFGKDHLDLLDHVQWQDALNFGQTNQILRKNPDDRFGNSRLYNITTIAPHYIEVSNRIISALSAYDLHMAQVTKRGLRGDALEAEKAKARDFAVQTIRDADGDHSQANLARYFGRRGFAHGVTPLIVGFQTFFILTTENMVRQLIKLRAGSGAERVEAAKTLAGVTSMTSLMAGTLGMPFMGLITAIANGIGSLFQDKGDEPPDLQLAVRQLTGKMVAGMGLKGDAAKKMEEVLSRGLPRLLDIDMSARSGFQDLAPFTAFLEDRRKLEDKIKDHMFNFTGPAIGAVAGIATGVQAAFEGDWPKAINDGLPSFVKGYAKAYRQANYGYETEGGGNRVPIAAPTAWNLLAQTQGFTSGKRAEQSEIAFEFKTRKSILERRQQELRNRMYRAHDQGDYQEMSRLMQEEVRFIMKNPQFHMNLQSGLKQRAEAQAVGAATGTGILASKRDIYPIMKQFQPQGTMQ